MKINTKLRNAGFAHVELALAVVVVAVFAVVGVRVLTVSHADSVSGVSAVVSTSNSQYQTVILANSNGTVTACKTWTKVFYRSVVAAPAAYVQVGLSTVATPVKTTNVVTILRNRGVQYNTVDISGKSKTAYKFWASITKINITADKTYKGGGVLLANIKNC